MTGEVYMLRYRRKDFPTFSEKEGFKYYEDCLNRVKWLLMKGKIEEGGYSIKKEYLPNRERVTSEDY